MKKKELTNKTIEMRYGIVKPPRENCNWRPSEINKLARLYAKGVGISELAILLERSEMGIVQKLDTMGYYDAAKIRRRHFKSERVCLCDKCELKGSLRCSQCIDATVHAEE